MHPASKFPVTWFKHCCREVMGCGVTSPSSVHRCAPCAEGLETAPKLKAPTRKHGEDLSRGGARARGSCRSVPAAARLGGSGQQLCLGLLLWDFTFSLAVQLPFWQEGAFPPQGFVGRLVSIPPVTSL